MQNWRAQGLNIHWITLLLDNPNEGAPTIEGAETWKNQYGLTLSAVGADPNFSMVPGNSVGTPQFTIINPRTMEVQSVQSGLALYGLLEDMANENAVQ